MDETLAAAQWTISGRVQGVGFRWFVLEAARRFGVRGDVRNLRDGRVEVRAMGAPESLGRLLGELRAGPATSRVEGIETSDPDGSWEFDGFDVRY